jgi:hypothetical protein
MNRHKGLKFPSAKNANVVSSLDVSIVEFLSAKRQRRFIIQPRVVPIRYRDYPGFRSSGKPTLKGLQQPVYVIRAGLNFQWTNPRIPHMQDDDKRPTTKLEQDLAACIAAEEIDRLDPTLIEWERFDDSVDY